MNTYQIGVKLLAFWKKKKIVYDDQKIFLTGPMREHSLQDSKRIIPIDQETRERYICRIQIPLFFPEVDIKNIKLKRQILKVRISIERLSSK